MDEADETVDSQKTVARICQRIEWAALVPSLAERGAAAEAAERACADFQRETIERAQRAKEHYQKLVAAKASALAEYQQALNAKENLIDSAEESPEKQAIGEELTTLSQAIDRCKSSLTRYVAGPVASAQAIRTALRDAAKLAPNQRADLESQLRARGKRHRGGDEGTAGPGKAA